MLNKNNILNKIKKIIILSNYHYYYVLPDPVLRRAQFNQKVINMTQQDEATRARLSKRAVSMETRRFAAIRLAATSTSLSQVGNLILWDFSHDWIP